MSVLGTMIGSASGMVSIDQVANAIKTINQYTVSGKNAMDNVKSLANRSITSYIKSTMILGKIIVERRCANEEILPDLMQVLHHLYVGWVLTALNLGTFVGDTKTTMKKFIETVATECMQYANIDDFDILTGFEHGVDKVNMNRILQFKNKTIAKINQTNKIDTINENDTISELIVINENDQKSTSLNNPSVSTKFVEIPDKVALPVGRVIEAKFNAANGEKATINLFVQMMPSFIHDRVLNQFFSLGFKPSLMQRFFQVTTGEKKFFRDFLFELDRSKERINALKNDKTGQLQELLKHQQNGIRKHASKIAARSNAQNLSNAVIIMDKYDFDKACKDNNCNFNQFSDRESFFYNTFTTCMVVIDSDYQTVDMYFAGLDTKGTYGFKQLKVQSKDERTDLLSVMKTFYSNTAPRF